MCLFIETIRIEDGQVYNLDYHTQRLNCTRAAFWKGVAPIDLNDVISFQNQSGIQKCRIVYGKEIEEITYTPYQIRNVQSLRLMTSDNIDYTYKSTDREALNSLFAQRGPADDILIIKNGCLTDTSIANIALYDGNQWLTPATPLLRGVKRAELLDKGIIAEREILVSELKKYSRMMLFNAMIEWGRMELKITGFEPSQCDGK